MEEILYQLNRIEYKIDQLLELLEERDSPDATRWLPEARVMYLLSLSKRTLARLRSQGVFRTSSATGKKIKYYRVDVENYLYENSSVRKPPKRGS